MAKRGIKIILLSSIILLSLAITCLIFASAFEAEEVVIKDSYGTGENLQGGADIEASQDLATSTFRAVFQRIYSSEQVGESLLDVLNINNITYTCIPGNCKDGYDLTNAATEKNLMMDNGQEKLLAFKMSGQNLAFKSLSFSVSANNSPSCMSPVAVDLFDDGNIDWQAENLTSEYTCNLQRGCFSYTSSSDTVFINEKPYCEKIKLPVSKNFMIGAWVKKGSTAFNTELLEMSMYTLENAWLASCDLSEPSTNGSEIGCTIDYENTEEQYVYVCIASNEETDYEIKTESQEPCGFFSYLEDFSGNFIADYSIFASTPKFGRAGNIAFSGLDLEVEDYLTEQYNNNCSSGCVIPLKLISNSNSSISVSNLSLSYTSDIGARIEKNIYDAEKSPLKLSSKPSQIDLSSLGIIIPSSPGKYNLTLYFVDKLIGSKSIQVERLFVISGVYPHTAVLKNPTTFQVILIGNVSVSEFEWNFGDGIITKTSERKAVHAYNVSGIYSARVIVRLASGNNYSTSFNVSVGSAKDAVNYTLDVYQKRINSIDLKILSIMPSWFQNQARNKILGNISSEVISLRQRFAKATTDSEYISILDALYAMQVPSSISITLQGEMPYYTSTNQIDINKLKQLGAGENAAKEKISIWMNDNLNLKLAFKIISIGYTDGEKNFGTLLTLNILPKQEKDIKNFVVIEGTSDFNPALSVQGIDDSYGMTFESLNQRNIEFFKQGITSPDKVVLYISPEFSTLGEVSETITCNFNGQCESDNGENSSNCQDCRGSIVTPIIIGIVIVGILAFIFMIWWYRNKYESHLFKEKKELYNLTSFIRSAKREGMQRGEISNKLKKEGWTSEQISYGLMKVEGGLLARMIGVGKSKVIQPE